MKVITSPRVYLIGFQQVSESGLDAYLSEIDSANWQTDAPSAAERTVEVGGRTCYQSFRRPRPGGNSEYIRHLKEVGHGSVLEHAVYTFVITGVSRSLTHELVRHRAGFAYSQLSQRYVDESAAEYVCPRAIIEDPESFAIWQDAIEYAHAAYVKLVERQMSLSNGKDNGTESRKAARGAARSVLPNATETKIQVTANARAIRHFIEQRATRHADEEIRRLAVALWQRVRDCSPNIFIDYSLNPLPDGTVELTTPYPKV